MHGATSLKVLLSESATNKYRVFIYPSASGVFDANQAPGVGTFVKNFTTNRTIPLNFVHVPALDGSFCCDQAKCAGGHSAFLQEGPGNTAQCIAQCESKFNATCNFVTLFNSATYCFNAQYCNTTFSPSGDKGDPTKFETYKRLGPVPGASPPPDQKRAINYTLCGRWIQQQTTR